MHILHKDIFVQICNHVTDIKLLIRLELLSEYHKKIIRGTAWMNITVKIRHTNIIDHVIYNYHFKKYDFRYTGIDDSRVVYLKNCHTLNFSGTNITDYSVAKLKNCYKL